MKLSFKQLEQKIKYKFNNIKILEQSLTHKSLSSDFNNENLNFSVIEYWV